MHALDRWFVRLVDANPALRVRVGNPDELRSNHMGAAPERLRHRVNFPAPGVADALDGAVITALTEEAVARAALRQQARHTRTVHYDASVMHVPRCAPPG